MAEWFGKGCLHQINQWENSEETAGPDYKEDVPIITFCTHELNPDNLEGNCRPSFCPLIQATRTKFSPKPN